MIIVDVGFVSVGGLLVGGFGGYLWEGEVLVDFFDFVGFGLSYVGCVCVWFLIGVSIFVLNF